MPILTLLLTNHYSVHHNLQSDQKPTRNKLNQNTRAHPIKVNTVPRKSEAKSAQLRTKQKIVVIGDNHTRGYASQLVNQLGPKYEVAGTLIPGVGLYNVTKLASNELATLTDRDVVVIWGGSNDVLHKQK